MTYTVAVAGASGYAGGELLRLLASHPDLEIKTVTAHSTAGQRLVDVQPHLRSLAHLTLVDTTVDALSGHDVVFFALPHGASGELSSQLSADTLVIDCAADHRLASADDWEKYYGGDFFQQWTYGIPELLTASGKQRAMIAGSKKIAAPGCNASAVTLGLAPGVNAGVIESFDIVTVLAVGPSGAGKAPKVNLLGSELMGSANPYAVGGSHRHIPEIIQSLRGAGAHDSITLSFTPVLVPMSRGILATSTARIAPGMTEHDVRVAYETAYANEPFVELLPAGQFPRTADTVGANTCLIGIAVDEAAGRVVVVSALDNLVKGTAGAAIQCANIALGLPETTGLSIDGVAP
jgi:N-acetyl-gamma-glutamyl-phosphate reductase